MLDASSSEQETSPLEQIAIDEFRAVSQTHSFRMRSRTRHSSRSRRTPWRGRRVVTDLVLEAFGHGGSQGEPGARSLLGEYAVARRDIRLSEGTSLDRYTGRHLRGPIMLGDSRWTLGQPLQWAVHQSIGNVNDEWIAEHAPSQEKAVCVRVRLESGTSSDNGSRDLRRVVDRKVRAVDDSHQDVEELVVEPSDRAEFRGGILRRHAPPLDLVSQPLRTDCVVTGLRVRRPLKAERSTDEVFRVICHGAVGCPCSPRGTQRIHDACVERK